MEGRDLPLCRTVLPAKQRSKNAARRTALYFHWFTKYHVRITYATLEFTLRSVLT